MSNQPPDGAQFRAHLHLSLHHETFEVGCIKRQTDLYSAEETRRLEAVLERLQALAKELDEYLSWFRVE